MNINELSIKNIRNIREFNGEFSNCFNIFIGNNAHGKSNLIDGLFFVGNLKSFRSNDDSEMINFNENEAKIVANITKTGINNSISINFFRDINKKVVLNNKKVFKISDYIGRFNITLFSPDDLLIIKGDSSYRRRFMDNLFSQIDIDYLTCLIEYFKVLKQRNQLLKLVKSNVEREDSLDPWDEQLVKLSSKIYVKRIKKTKFINETTKNIHIILKNEENLNISYKDTICCGSEVSEADYEILFKNKLKRVRSDEIIRGTSLYGPHRDDLEIEINNVNTRIFGSQGQKRSAAISMRMGEAEIIKTEFNEYPVLLLDDIFSELDDGRKNDLLSVINNKSQVFITGTNIKDFKNLANQADVFHIQNGEISVTHAR